MSRIRDIDLRLKGQGNIYVKSVKTRVLIRLNVCGDELHKLGILRARETILCLNNII